MELFSKLSEIMANGSVVTITVAKKEEALVVSVLPGTSLVKDAALKKLQPLNIKGTAQELDEGFVDAISTPVAQVNKMFVDMKNFEDSQKAAKEASEMEKKAKDEAKNNKELFAKWIALAEQNLKECKYKDATTCAKNALKYADLVPGGHSKADGIIKKVSEESAGGLFGAAEDKSDGKNIKVASDKPTTTQKKDSSDDNDDDE